MPQIAGEQKKEPDRGKGKHKSDEALRQHVQRAGNSQPPAVHTRRARFLQCAQKKIQRQEKPQADEDIRNQKARKEIRPKRESSGDRRVESSGLTEVAPSDNKHRKD